MYRVIGTTISLVLGFVFFVFVTSGNAAHDQFVCDLKVNKVGPKPANTSAHGNVIFDLDKDKKELSYKIQVADIEDVYMVHVHMGPSGKEGIIATWLYPVGDHNSENRTIEGKFNGTIAEGVIKKEDIMHGITFEELIESLKNGNAYVSVHTEKFVMGAIRGQVYSQEFASNVERNTTAEGLK
jgi:hypothetical protein